MSTKSNNNNNTGKDEKLTVDEDETEHNDIDPGVATESAFETENKLEDDTNIHNYKTPSKLNISDEEMRKKCSDLKKSSQKSLSQMAREIGISKTTFTQFVSGGRSLGEEFKGRVTSYLADPNQYMPTEKTIVTHIELQMLGKSFTASLLEESKTSSDPIDDTELEHNSITGTEVGPINTEKGDEDINNEVETEDDQEVTSKFIATRFKLFNSFFTEKGFSHWKKAKYEAKFGAPTFTKLPITKSDLEHRKTKELPILFQTYDELAVPSHKEVYVEDKILLLLINLHNEVPELLKLHRQYTLECSFANGPVEFVFTHRDPPHIISLIIEAKKRKHTSNLESKQYQLLVEMRAAYAMNLSLINREIPIYGILSTLDSWIIYRITGHNEEINWQRSTYLRVNDDERARSYLQISGIIKGILEEQQKVILEAIALSN